jgi:hypothetical protein
MAEEFVFGRWRTRVDEPAPAPAPEPKPEPQGQEPRAIDPATIADAQADELGHRFDQVSRVARADPRVTDRAYRVLATIESYCWGESRSCFATNRTIGTQSGGVGPETVRRAIRCLEKAGYLRVEEDKTRMRGSRIVLLYKIRKGDLPPLDY